MGELWDDNNDNEMDEFHDEQEGSNFIDVKQIIEKAENLPLSGYFLETRKNCKKRSAVSWLETCDPDTVDLITSYGKKVREEELGSAEEAIENNGKDIFDLQLEGDDAMVSDEEDFYTLVLLILSWENNIEYIDNNSISEAAISLGVYSAIDVLKRNGIVKTKGSGTLLSKKTEYVLTNKCKKMTKKELTAALKSISKDSAKK